MLVTPAELAQWLDRYQGGCRICSVTMLTPLVMNKTSRVTKEPNPYLLADGESTIDHLQERLVFCGANYENMVNNVRQKTLQANADGYIPAFEAAALWSGNGRHVNSYVAEHIVKQCFYLCCFYARVREGMEWVEKSLKQEAWLDRLTGLEVAPDWADLAQYLPPKAKPSIKQGCREGCDIEVDIDGNPYRIEGGEIRNEIKCRMPHLENVLSIRSFDLKQRGKYETIQVRRGKHQVSV